jgi:methylated-DNA-protein-cysteine methyltransferase-like protein
MPETAFGCMAAMAIGRCETEVWWRARKAFESMAWEPIYRLVKKIPRGRVTTYGEIAKKLGVRGGARVVGYAMAGCPNRQGIPWHRVIGACGKLLIAEPHRSLQRKLLESEGVKLGERRIDMKTYAWGAEKHAAAKRNPRKSITRSKMKARSRLRG